MKTCDLPAYIVADLINTKQVSAVEVLEDTLERIRLVDGRTGEVDARKPHLKKTFLRSMPLRW